MLIIVGLGNPGGKYAANRHNIGFMAVDSIALRHHFPAWKKAFQADVTEGRLGGERVMLMKPQTYMNESGRAVGEAMRFHKLQPSDIVVVHDELDLPPGKLRMKVGGGHGGHNGLRSITAHISDAYRRMRLGIGHPGAKELVHGHVLSDFHKVDGTWLEPLMDAIADNAELLAKGEDATFGNRIHLAQGGGKPAKPAPSKTPSPKIAPAGTAGPTGGEAPAAAPKGMTALADQLRAALLRKKK